MPEFKARREIAPREISSFATQLTSSMGGDQPAARNGSAAQHTSKAPPKRAPDPADLIGAAGSFEEDLDPKRGAILDRADKLLAVPYVWGGDSPKGLDCSSYVSRAWGVSRHTTDNLSQVADPIAKADLQAGDAMNLPTWKDPNHYGHVRMFDRWGDAAHKTMWVYEETADTGNSVYRKIPYDDRYQPMRLKGLT
jgi:cell wall-associated NlpC family hydrolase